MGNFVPGHLVPVSWQATGFANTAVLNVKEHSLDITCMLHDVTGVKANGLRARLAGVVDVAGRVVLDFDIDEAPFLQIVAISPGFRGIARWGVTPTAAIQVPLQCEKVHFAGATDKEVMWDADFKCNSLVGAFVYPAL